MIEGNMYQQSKITSFINKKRLIVWLTEGSDSEQWQQAIYLLQLKHIIIKTA